ncbi:SHOCT domain-containing protein, partial [Candidatus Woesearchaeota archaeon]|nr:SHOCT domain-containing protein [Candidatus Woesearchaeota archaeon]
ENESAIEILKKRLAKGEIDAKEYEKLKKEIEK